MVAVEEELADDAQEDMGYVEDHLDHSGSRHHVRRDLNRAGMLDFAHPIAEEVEHTHWALDHMQLRKEDEMPD